MNPEIIIIIGFAYFTFLLFRKIGRSASDGSLISGGIRLFLTFFLYVKFLEYKDNGYLTPQVIVLMLFLLLWYKTGRHWFLRIRNALMNASYITWRQIVHVHSKLVGIYTWVKMQYKSQAESKTQEKSSRAQSESEENQGRNEHKQEQSNHRYEPDNSTDVNDPYSILGLTPNCSREVCKNVYRKLCLAYHPDKYANQSSHVVRYMTEKTAMLNKAKERLNL